MTPMLYLPFATIADEDDGIYAHVLMGLAESGQALVGLDPIDGEMFEFEPSSILSLVSLDPAAVMYGVEASFREQGLGLRMVANPARGQVPRYRSRGGRFPMLPAGTVSGYPVAAKLIRKLRATVPSLEAIRKSALFALSTVRVGIEEAEESFGCFAELYDQYGDMPDASVIVRCFNGLRNQKSRQFVEAAEYAEVIRAAIKSGLRDRELRRHLCLETKLPSGLGMAKVSFTLALLGHDTVCIDARLLNTMFPDPDKRQQFEKLLVKRKGMYSELTLARYEALERVFLEDNPHYDPSDPLGAARAQWLSWEAVGGAGATHSTWMKTIQHGLPSHPTRSRA